LLQEKPDADIVMMAVVIMSSKKERTNVLWRALGFIAFGFLSTGFLKTYRLT
jgi:hypothetical protein